jgi:predicted Zn-dependent protease
MESEFLSLEAISDRIETALRHSPADETEIVWLEKRRGKSRKRNRQIEARLNHERTIMVRVIDRRRVGSHRTGFGEIGELENGIRAAIAQSRSREPLPGLLHIPADETPTPELARLWDSQIANLNAKRAERLLEPWAGSRGTLDLQWTAARIAVFNTRGVRRQAAVTAAGVEARIGRRPGGGRAASAARSLDGLDIGRVFERAKQRHASGQEADLTSGPRPIVLSAEATAGLCDILNRVAFSAVSYYQGSSFLREHLDVQVFDRAIHLRDDATDPSGLPFPFDLEGTAKRPVDLILKGAPKTPAVDQRQAAQLGLEATAHAIGGNDARAMNLYLAPGDLSEEQLLEAAEGGLWIGWLDQVECFEPSRVQVRAVARGVRRIADGKLAEGLPDLVWEDSLLRAFSNLLGVGSEPVLRISHDGVLGGISTPAMAIADTTNLRPLLESI